MDDSLALAKLTLMLLRASVPHPESLSADYGVIMPPSNDVLSRDEAVLKVAQIRGEVEVSASTKGRALVVLIHQPAHRDMQRLAVAGGMFREGIRSLNSRNQPDALIRAVGFRESMLVPAQVVEQWLQLVDCADCPMSLGRPGPEDSTSVVAVLYLGRTE